MTVFPRSVFHHVIPISNCVQLGHLQNPPSSHELYIPNSLKLTHNNLLIKSLLTAASAMFLIILITNRHLGMEKQGVHGLVPHC